jgi:hypothetical protein
MDFDVDATSVGEGANDLFERRSLWRGVAIVLGISLWAQLYWYPLATEFLSERAGGLFVGAYLLPLLVLFVAVIFRHAAGYLFFVPSSLVPGLVLLPQQDVGSLLEPYRLVFASGTLLGFILAGALAGRPDTGRPVSDEELEDEPVEQIEGIYRHYFLIRFVILLALFGVLVGSVFFDPTMVQAIVANHEDGEVAARIFLAVFGFFTWCVLAYAMFFRPAANIAYDVRKLRRQIHALARGKSHVRRRIGFVWLAVAVGAGGLYLVTYYA